MLGFRAEVFSLAQGTQDHAPEQVVESLAIPPLDALELRLAIPRSANSGRSNQSEFSHQTPPRSLRTLSKRELGGPGGGI
jgi:hypothetical protein